MQYHYFLVQKQCGKKMLIAICNIVKHKSVHITFMHFKLQILDINHYHTNLCMLGITCFSGAQLIFISKTDAENSEEIAVSSFYINISFYQGLPFFNHGSQFICSQVHAMEIGQNITMLNVFSNQPKFTEGSFCISVILQICQRDLKYSVFQAFRSYLCKIINIKLIKTITMYALYNAVAINMQQW